MFCFHDFIRNTRSPLNDSLYLIAYFGIAKLINTIITIRDSFWIIVLTILCASFRRTMLLKKNLCPFVVYMYVFDLWVELKFIIWSAKPDTLNQSWRNLVNLHARRLCAQTERWVIPTYVLSGRKKMRVPQWASASRVINYVYSLLDDPELNQSNWSSHTKP